MIIAMGDNLIGQVLDQVQQRFTSAWEWLWDPLWQWYAVGFAILLFVMLIAYFLPFKWVRAGLGLLLLFVGTYIAGGYQMRQHYKQRLEEEIRKRKEAERSRNQPSEQAGDGNWWRW